MAESRITDFEGNIEVLDKGRWKTVCVKSMGSDMCHVMGNGDEWWISFCNSNRFYYLDWSGAQLWCWQFNQVSLSLMSAHTPLPECFTNFCANWHNTLPDKAWCWLMIYFWPDYPLNDVNWQDAVNGAQQLCDANRKSGVPWGQLNCDGVFEGDKCTVKCNNTNFCWMDHLKFSAKGEIGLTQWQMFQCQNIGEHLFDVIFEHKTVSGGTQDMFLKIVSQDTWSFFADIHSEEDVICLARENGGRSHKEKASIIHNYLKKTYSTNNEWVVIVYDDIWLYKNHFMTGHYIHLFRNRGSNIFASHVPKTNPCPNLFCVAVTLTFERNNDARSLRLKIWKFIVKNKMPVHSIIIIRKCTTIHLKESLPPQRLFPFISINF